MVQKKENLRRMLEGQPHEHIPVSFFQHLKPEELHGEACVKAHIRFYKQTDPDFLKIMHDGLTAPVDLGLTSLEELKAYRPIKGQNPYIREYLERALRINESLADETDTYSNIFSPFTLLRRIGDDRLLGFLREDPQAVKDALLFMGEDLAYLSEKLIQEAGCLGIFLAMQGAENGLFTPEEFADYIAPSEQLVLSAAQESSSFISAAGTKSKISWSFGVTIRGIPLTGLFMWNSCPWLREENISACAIVWAALTTAGESCCIPGQRKKSGGKQRISWKPTGMLSAVRTA